MPDNVNITLYDATDKSYRDSPGTCRRLAVEAALEVIRANGYGSSDHDRLDYHMGHLSEYADAIQKALEVKGSK